VFNLELVSLLLIIFHYWLDIFTELLPASLLEQVKKKSGDFEWVLEILTQYSLTVDSTEQPIERPSDREEQKSFSQESRKSYPKKSIYCSTKSEDIVDVKVGDPGPTSDINQFRRILKYSTNKIRELSLQNKKIKNFLLTVFFRACN